MSLTEDISGLVARASALLDVFDAKKGAIDAAVAAAIATVPDMSRTVYLNQQAGSDANSGLTEASAVKTMAKAVALIGAGRFGMVWLMSDYVFDVPRLILPPNITLYIRGPNDGTVRNLILPVLPSVDQSTYQQEVAGFFAANYGRVEISLFRVNIVFPATPLGGGVLAPPRYSSFLGTGLQLGPTSINIALSTCEIIRPADGAGVLIGAQEGRPTHLGLQYVTHPSAMAGKWIDSVAAGTAASGLKWLNTNLTTL